MMTALSACGSDDGSSSDDSPSSSSSGDLHGITITGDVGKEPTVKWDGVEWGERAGVPWIEGTVARLACGLEALHEGGDHVIATGPVRELEVTGGDPLVFWGGAYHPLRVG